MDGGKEKIVDGGRWEKKREENEEKKEKRKGSLSGICVSSSNEIYKNKNCSCACTQKIITKYL